MRKIPLFLIQVFVFGITISCRGVSSDAALSSQSIDTIRQRIEALVAKRGEEFFNQADYLAHITALAKDDDGMLGRVYLSGFYLGDSLVATVSHFQSPDYKVIGLYISFKSDERKTYQADVVYCDRSADIAILKIRGDHPPNIAIPQFSVTFCCQEDVYSLGRIGEKPWRHSHGQILYIDFGGVQSIGGFSHSCLIQFGFSGGPVLNGNGEIIGMNSRGRFANLAPGRFPNIKAIPVGRILEQASRIRRDELSN